MIDPDHQGLGIARQCALVSIARSTFYYQGKGESPLNPALMHRIDARFLETPWYGSRQDGPPSAASGLRGRAQAGASSDAGHGLTAIYRKPRSGQPNPTHRIYPYLLRGLAIERTDQVWRADVGYIPMRHGFPYLVAIMDRWSRRVPGWRLSNTLVGALEEALARHGRPEIFNTDQGCRFTGMAFTQVLKDAGVKISMDGRGRWTDNVMIERPWRSLKYECVYPRAFERGTEARAGIGSWITCYNTSRPHSVFGGRTPDEVYTGRDAPSPGHAPEMAPKAPAA